MAKFVPASTIPTVIARSTAQESKAATEVDRVERSHPGQVQDYHAPQRKDAVYEGQHLDRIPNARGNPLLDWGRRLGRVELGGAEPRQRRDGHEQHDDTYTPDPLTQAAPEQQGG